VGLLSKFYDGEAPPPFEVEAFVRFFDRKHKGKISWSDFREGFGLASSMQQQQQQQGQQQKTGAAGSAPSADPRAILKKLGPSKKQQAVLAQAQKSNKHQLGESGGQSSEDGANNDGDGDGDANEASEAAGAVAAAVPLLVSAGGTVQVEVEGGNKVEVRRRGRCLLFQVVF
jgi:hypothetical protein